MLGESDLRQGGFEKDGIEQDSLENDSGEGRGAFAVNEFRKEDSAERQSVNPLFWEHDRWLRRWKRWE